MLIGHLYIFFEKCLLNFLSNFSLNCFSFQYWVATILWNSGYKSLAKHIILQVFYPILWVFLSLSWWYNLRHNFFLIWKGLMYLFNPLSLTLLVLYLIKYWLTQGHRNFLQYFLLRVFKVLTLLFKTLVHLKVVFVFFNRMGNKSLM